MISVKCKNCGASYRAKEQSVGKQTKCLVCGAAMQIQPAAPANPPRLNVPEEIGNVDAVCPHCNQGLDTKPGRKKKCPHCGEFIYVRTRPSDEKRVLVTEAQAEKIEEQWSIVNGTHDAYVAEKRRVAERTGMLAERFGRPPSDNDVRWSLLNDDLLDHMQQRNWGLFRLLAVWCG